MCENSQYTIDRNPWGELHVKNPSGDLQDMANSANSVGAEEKTAEDRLFRAIAEKRWDEALTVLRDPTTARIQAGYINRIGTDTATALHIACRYNDTPVLIVKRVLEENPDAALHQTGDGGVTPLHIAALWSSLNVFRMLLEGCPRAASVRSDFGSVPLHLVCARGLVLDPEKIRLLLRADPSQLSTQDGYGLTPLDSFFSKFNRFMRECDKDELFFPICLSFRSIASCRLKAGTTPFNILIVANDLLYTYLHGHWSLQGVRDRNWRMVHGSLRVRSCPWVFSKFALGAFPEQAFEHDMEGNLPLHIAASADSLIDGEFYECHHCRKSPIYGTRYHHKEYMDVYCPDCFPSHIDRSEDQYYAVIAGRWKAKTHLSYRIQHCQFVMPFKKFFHCAHSIYQLFFTCLFSLRSLITSR